MAGNRHLPGCWGRTGARRVRAQSQQGQLHSTGTTVQCHGLSLLADPACRDQETVTISR